MELNVCFMDKLLKRKIDSFLPEWKRNPGKKPLIVKGARQIGKTRSIEWFAYNNYSSVVEINFVEQPKYKGIFEEGFEVDGILKNISLLNPDFTFVPHDTLFFFDELQACPNCATALKFFKLDGRYDVICSGSLMGINYKEIESNSVNTVGNIVLSNGEAEGNVIHDIVLISTDEDTGESRTVLSERGTLELIDSWNYIYSLQLEKPEILISDRDDLESYGLSSAESAVFFLDFSEQIPSLTSSAPVNLSSRDLISGIQDRAVMEEEDIARWHHDREAARLSFADTLKNAGRGDASVSDITTAAAEATNTIVSRGNRIPRNFYSQYYKAELTKKFVLSAACFCLTLITLPLSMFRVKHGKLTGFAISLLIAVAYWYMLFGVQLEIFNISSSPYLLIALPDIAILLIAVVLIMRFRKAR